MVLGRQQIVYEPTLMKEFALLQAKDYSTILGEYESADLMFKDLLMFRDFRVFLILFTRPGFIASDINAMSFHSDEDYEAYDMFKLIINMINACHAAFKHKVPKLSDIFLIQNYHYRSHVNFCKIKSEFYLPSFPIGLWGTHIFNQAVDAAGSKRYDVYDRLPKEKKKVIGFYPVIEWFIAKGELLQLNSYAGKIEHYSDDPKTLKKAIIEKDHKTTARYIRSYVHFAEKTRNNLRTLAKYDYCEILKYVKRQDKNHLQCFISGIAAPVNRGLIK